MSLIVSLDGMCSDLLWVDGCDRKHPLLKRLADDFLSMFDPATDSLEIEAQRSLRWSERSRAYSNSLDRVLERTDQFYREGQQHAQAHKKYNYDMGMITYVTQAPRRLTSS